MTQSSHKRYTQKQLTELFLEMSGIVDPDLRIKVRQLWWTNPTDPDSLRLSYHGLKLVKSTLQLTSFEFDLSIELSNQNLLQLERNFSGMYFLLERQKIIVFDEQEATMLTLHGNNLQQYLQHLNIANQ